MNSKLFDYQTLERLADFICGDNTDEYPVYRSSSKLTLFFKNVGFSNFVHDGSTRKWWILGVLKQLTDNNIKAVIIRLANPREYNGNQEKAEKAIRALNEIIRLDGFLIKLDGVKPIIEACNPGFAEPKTETIQAQLPKSNFEALDIESDLKHVLSERWSEANRCFAAEAYLMTIIALGSLLEGLLLSLMQHNPQAANLATCAPKDCNGKVLKFHQWTLSEMINAAHEAGWIDTDVQKFSHSLREFRNLIHPYEQKLQDNYPDKDTCEIGIRVVQATIHDIQAHIK
jgi:hypothetical protein